MAQKPLEVYMDPEVVARTRAALNESRERVPMAQSTRQQLDTAPGV